MAKANRQQDFNIRHRLVGAIVLLGLGVVIIPMILQGKGPGAVIKSDSLTEEVQEWIVGTEDAKTYTTRVIPIGEQAAATQGGSAASNADGGAVLGGDAAPELLEVVDDQSDGEIRPLQNSAPNVAEPAPEKQPTNVAQSAVVEQPAQNAQPKDNQVAAVKLPEPAPVSDLKPENVSRGWVVQVGTFSKTTNAQNLITKLNKGGFESRYEVINTDSGQATRVWVGPYEKRVTAARALESVNEKTGIKGFIKSYP